MVKLYAGVGYRKTPIKTLAVMIRLAYRLAKKGYILRSGAALGADTKFEKGCDLAKGKKEIWLPWKGFNDHTSKLTPKQVHYDLAKEIHPAWEYLTSGVKALMARNVAQILGEDGKTPVSLVICYTEDGVESHHEVTKKSGGTGFAISIAGRYGIPVFNLKRENAISRINMFLDEYRIFED